MINFLKGKMAGKHKAGIGAGIGAVIGGGIASVLAIWLGGGMIATKCELAVCSQTMGFVGLVSGAICGVTIVKLADNKSDVMFAVFAWVGIILVSMIPVGLYTTMFRACPAPRPYPGFSVTKREMVGASGWRYRSQIYTATLSVDDLQQYYSEQMNRYCEDVLWHFQDSSEPEYAHCREASCQIRFSADPQFFSVYLCPVTETQIKVIQKDMWDFD